MRRLGLDMRLYEGGLDWRWELSDEAAAQLAACEIAIDAPAPEHEGFLDLHRYLRLRSGSHGAAASQAALVAGVGEWIGRTVLGPIAGALAAAARDGPCVVTVRAPAAAAAILDGPLELAHVDGRPLAAHGVSFVYASDVDAERRTDPGAAERPLRMVAALSLPIGATPLALRRERQELEHLATRLAAAEAEVELRILQHGVTRAELTRVLAEPPGWDVVHYSGHGTAGLLTLEGETGGVEPVTAVELVELLGATRDRLRLVTLSSCESAAATLATSLDQLGVAAASEAVGERAGEIPRTRIPGTARLIADELDCAVVAMRYPVEDRYGLAFTARLYDELLIGRAPLPLAFQAAQTSLAGSGGALSAVAPTLVGTLAGGLRLLAAHRSTAVVGEPAPDDSDGSDGRGRLPEPPAHFVGRLGPLTRASRVLAGESPAGETGVLFLGGPGMGTTACAVELAHLVEHRFDHVVWAAAADDLDDLDDLLGRFDLDRDRVLVVVDDVDRRADASVVEALPSAGGRCRVILTGHRRPHWLGSSVLVEPVHPLSDDESVLLARDLTHLGALIRGDHPTLDPEEGRTVVRRVLRDTAGHPSSLHRAESLARDGVEHIADLAADPAMAERTRSIDGWVDQVAASLTEPERNVFHFLCCMAAHDRRADVVDLVWPRFWQAIAPERPRPDHATAARQLAQVGLVEVAAAGDDPSTTYRVHPAIATAGASAVDRDIRGEVAATLGRFCVDAAIDGLENETGDGLSYLVRDAGKQALP